MAKQQDREKALARRLSVLMRIVGRWDTGIEEPRLGEHCDRFFDADIKWLIQRGLVDRAAPERGPTGAVTTPARVWPSMVLKKAAGDER